jgi:lysine-N-methylase
VRQHVIDGDLVIVLHGPPPAAGVACLGPREWAFIACADGTRDLEGIRLAAARVDRKSTTDHLVAFFDQLARAGMLGDGPGTQHEETSPTSSVALPVDPLPGFALRCDGSGTCCRLYPTTTFLPLDVARARALCPDVLDGAHHPERVFTPITSSSARSWEPRAVTMNDGRCAYLDGEGSCRVHAAGSEELKPGGCRLFPMRFVDDGTCVRVAPAPECRCVFTSPPTGGAAAEPIVPDAATVVERVENVLRVDERTSWPRARYLAWSADALERLQPQQDGVQALWELAHELSPTEVTISELANRFRAVLERHNAKQTWRHVRDLARRIPTWMEGATHVETSRGALTGENFYLRAIAHSHAWVLDGVPLVVSLRERAARLFIARRLHDAFTDEDRADDDAALTEPIALVEACCRAFQLFAGE